MCGGGCRVEGVEAAIRERRPAIRDCITDVSWIARGKEAQKAWHV